MVLGEKKDEHPFAGERAARLCRLTIGPDKGIFYVLMPVTPAAHEVRDSDRLSDREVRELLVDREGEAAKLDHDGFPVEIRVKHWPAKNYKRGKGR